MSITINLMSSKKGELKKFWETFDEGYHRVDDDVVEWIYIYNTPEDAVVTINDVMGKKSDFDISLWIQLGDDDLIAVNDYNCAKVVDGIYNFLNQSQV